MARRCYLSTQGMSSRIGLVLLVAWLSGCDVYDETLLARDGAMDGGDAGTSCSPLANPPTRPAIADDGNSEVVFALRNISLNQDGDRWRSIGFDLDGLCSGGAGAAVECDPMTPGANSSLDGEHGIDNAFGRAITPLLSAAYPTLEAEAQELQTLGLGVIVLRIANWNGEANDSRVHATFTQSAYGTPSLADGGVPMPELPDGGPNYADGGDPPVPQWNGDDYWWGRADSFFDNDPTRPITSDDNAYIANRTLVMHLPDGREIVFAGDTRGVNFRLTDARLVAEISSDGTRVTRATLVGRWALNDVLEAVQHAGVCTDNPLYMTLSNLLRTAVDVRSVPGSGGAGVECDALSVGLLFDGVSAHFAGIGPAYPLPDSCAGVGP